MVKYLLYALVALTSLVGAAANADDPPPNILLIIADDLGYTDLGSYGGEISTPSLDALAYGGLRFTGLHTASACQQVRSMLMSGRGFKRVIRRMPPRDDGERQHQLRTDVATLPEFLQAAGYRTYLAGKWDLGLTPETMPIARGFDRSFTLLEASSSHFAEYFWDDVSYYQEDDRHVPLADLPEDFYSTRSYTDKILEYIATQPDDAPWFSMLTYTAPHWPLQAPDEWLNRHAGRYDEGYDVLRRQRVSRAVERGVIPPGASLDRFRPIATPWVDLPAELQRRYARAQEIYAAMTELLDGEVGRIVEYLEERDQLNSTVILFLSDHGASAAEIGIQDGPTSMPDHFDTLEAARDNSFNNFGRMNSFIDHGRGFGEAATAPLRYFKGTLAEGALRAPAFIHFPPAIAEGGISHSFITVMDILPTLLEIAEAAGPGDMEIDGRDMQPLAGRSFWPLVTGQVETVHDESSVAGWSRDPFGALIRGRYKLVNQTMPGQPVDGTPPWQLFDIVADPGETRDVAAMFPDIVEELDAIWRRDWQ